MPKFLASIEIANPGKRRINAGVTLQISATYQMTGIGVEETVTCTWQRAASRSGPWSNIPTVISPIWALLNPAVGTDSGVPQVVNVSSDGTPVTEFIRVNATGALSSNSETSEPVEITTRMKSRLHMTAAKVRI